MHDCIQLFSSVFLHKNQLVAEVTVVVVAAVVSLCSPKLLTASIQIVTDVEVTIENYFPVVGNIPRGRRMRGLFPTMGK